MRKVSGFHRERYFKCGGGPQAVKVDPVVIGLVTLLVLLLLLLAKMLWGG